ncbi:MAG: aldolase/citrate lyase family protein [Thermodesulfobacteriota bacterium]
MKINKMKAKLYAGEPAFGVSVMIPSPQIVEMVAGLGFDWVLIDCEHGTISLETVEILAMAAEASGITAIARPRTNDPDDILKVMDRGVMGIQVPHINSAADARRAVESVKFHPIGKRGLAAGTRPSGYGFGEPMDQFVLASNRETLVCVQLEDAEAVENVDDILQVDGVDVFFVGPSDLSQSMGYPGNPKAAPVREAIDTLFGKIAASGKIAGTPAGIADIKAVLDRGIRYTYNHLPKLLGSAAEEFFSAGRR